MNPTDSKFLQIIEDVMMHGDYLDTRNARVVRKTMCSVTFDSTPLVCIRKTAWKNALREWEWFMSGSNNINDLHPSVHSWWSEWADSNGYIDYNYSEQLRQFYGFPDTDWTERKNPHHGYDSFDQVGYITDGIKNHPNSRRLVLTTWNPYEMALDNCPITNCHGTVIQFFVQPDNSLDMTMYQRSADLLLGVPHNWIQYWAFLQWMAHATGRLVGKFHWIGGDVHIYNSHIETAYKMLKYDGECPPNIQMGYYPTSHDFKADDFILDAEYEPVFKNRLKMEV